MKILPLGPLDCFAIKPQIFSDSRGWFLESWNAKKMIAQGIDISWVQDNHSRSMSTGTLRGLHYQAPPHAQDKLVRCTRGAILDVAIDIRVGSPTYLHHVKLELNESNALQVFVPKGFLHGFVTLRDDTEVQYRCSDFYEPETDRSVRWDDPQIGLDWGLRDAPVLSEKDARAPTLEEDPSPFVWNKVS